MPSHNHELLIPPKASEDPQAVEIARIWSSGGKQHVSLLPKYWDDPACWGIMVVDLARHVAKAYAQATNEDQEKILCRIKQALEAEWGFPTDEVSGGFH